MKFALGALITAFVAVIIGAATLVSFWSSGNLSAKIENLKFAPERLLCERDEPTKISLNYYANGKESWRAIFAGRNRKDFLLGFIQFSKNSPQGQLAEFAFIDGRWKPANELTLKENLEFTKINIYTEEESRFLASCTEKIVEYLEKKEKEKKLYTPVLGVFSSLKNRAFYRMSRR